MCQIPTHALQQRAESFDHLVGSSKKRVRHGQAKRLGGLDVDGQLELGRLLDREVGGLLALEVAIDIGCGAAEQIGSLNSVGAQASAADELRNRIDCRQ